MDKLNIAARMLHEPVKYHGSWAPIEHHRAIMLWHLGAVAFCVVKRPEYFA